MASVSGDRLPNVQNTSIQDSSIEGRRAQETESPFDGVPDEILFHIFLNIKTPSDASHLLLVSRKFYHVMHDINELRLIIKVASDTLGDILKNIQPKTELMSILVDRIIKAFEMDNNQSCLHVRRIIGRFLSESEKYPESVCNQLLQTFLQLVKEYGNEEIFLYCLEGIYAGSPIAQKLYLARLTNTEPFNPFKEYSSVVASFSSKSAENPKGLFLDPESTFRRSIIPDVIRSYLSISPDYRFQEGEIVALSHTGQLPPGRRQLMYGVVKNEIVEEGNVPKYKVYTRLHESGDRKTWIDSAVLEPHMIGKIEKNHTTDLELGQKFKISHYL